ncbi:MAG: serine/threonine-protein kinase PknG [Actinomycetota bacterium]|nr:serine/threonine-protein kinase PknG [Actinomycetota bacterium]
MTVTACAQPGCTGTIQDGYCDVCGMPPGSVVPLSGAADPDAGAAMSGIGSSPSRPTSSSNRLASAPLGSVLASGNSRTARKGTSSARLRGARLGAGLTTVPLVPEIDAAAAVLRDPQVPEDRRFCPSCGNPVGRSREGRPGRTEGYCPQCRNPFSFSPKLAAGDLVNGQYEVAGCLAHGGLGWIYLAWDIHLNRRPVVLKGLLNAGDKDAYEAAQKEREFLARVAYPSIVKVYNFVKHDGAEYIVMEYVGGTSLKTILKDRMRANGGRYDPVPVDQAIAYIVEVLPAFQYLHDLGLLYCDFKPDNMIQVGDDVKLIDLGGVRLISDMDSAIYGTIGYQAPEVAQIGPTVPSDIYTIGRTLAVLIMEFRGYQTTYATSLPAVEETPIFRENDSLYRLIAKACAPDPADRFTSADEMRVQLVGVLREIVARTQPDVALHSAASVLFGPPAVTAERLDWHHLPTLRVDPGDAMASWLTTVSDATPAELLRALDGVRAPTVEVRLAKARAALGTNRPDIADQVVADVLTEDPWEWRAIWMQGLSSLVSGDVRAARAAFNAVYGQVPGELAPKLALAMACENSDEPDVAEALYATCARTDANYTAPAAFGLARIRAARGDVDGAVTALDMIPPTSRAFVPARQRRATMLAEAGRGLAGLAEALASIETVTIEPLSRARLRADVLASALHEVTTNGERPDLQIGGVLAREVSLRDGLELAYRHLAGLTPDPRGRIRLVDQANAVRRWSLR